MKDVKTNAKNITLHLLLLLGIFSTIGCSDDDKTTVIPEDWIQISSEAFSTTYKGSILERDFVVSKGVKSSHIYIISQAEWCLASIENGSKVNIEIKESAVIEERKTTVILIYDEQHQVSIPITQGAAPAALVKEIKFPTELLGQPLGAGQTFDLNSVMQILPENAGNKVLNYNITGDEGVISITDGILKTLSAGSATITAAATDASEITADITITVNNSLPFKRDLWTIDTSIRYENADKTNYVPDNTTGLPEHLLDEATTTYLSLAKPGKTVNGCNTPEGHELYFVVDTKAEQTFNYFIWSHRSSNSMTYLRIWGISIYGSHDGENFDVIQESVPIDYSTIENKIAIPKSTYRYIKAKLVDWSDLNGITSGSSLQVAEFNLGKE